MKRVFLHILAILLCGIPTSVEGQGVQPATLLGRWSDGDLPGSNAFDNTYNEVWGLALNGKEYAVIGSTMGTHIIDITRPQDAEEVAFIAGASRGSQIIHRDYHNYGCYLYAVSDEGEGSLQIIDVSGLPEKVNTIYDSAEFFSRCHNIFIDTASAVLYACFARGGDSPTVPLKLLDISDPARPVEIATYNEFGSGIVSHVHDCYVENGLAFLNLGFDGMAIVDFSDPFQPVRISTLTDYTFAGYNHSGWPTSDLRYYYLGDESHGFPLKVLDVSDPSEIEVVNTFDAESAADLSIPHNQVVACNYLFVSYYYEGLQVYDISNPAEPKRTSYFPTSSRSHRKSYEGAWGVYPFLPSGNILVSDMQEGLFVLSGPQDSCISNDQMTLQCDLLNPVWDQVAPGKSFSIYPVPAGDFVQIEFKPAKSQEKVNIRLLDTHGRQIKRWEREALSGKFQLTLTPGIPPGLYFLHLQLGVQHFIEKIIIRQ